MICHLCPRQCGVDRARQQGRCHSGETMRVARAALHFWEEPCLVGKGGSGAIFFTGCSLGCIYCQNRQISRGEGGREISTEKFLSLCDRLIEQGAENINLVTGSHFAAQIAEAFRQRKPAVPVVYNCGGYESVETLRLLEGLVDIYLPDMKYSDPQTAANLSAAPDYPEVAQAAINEMYRQTGAPVYNENGVLQRGVWVRHLVLPGHLENTYGVLDWFSSRFPKGEAGFSLMSQFTPNGACDSIPALCRRLTREEYEKATGYLYLCGIRNGFVQELSSAKEEYIPAFDGTGCD